MSFRTNKENLSLFDALTKETEDNIDYEKNATQSILKNPALSQHIIDRKYRYQCRGYHALDFPFPEITPTLNDIHAAIAKQLEELETLLSGIDLVNKDAKIAHHQALFKLALEHCKTKLTKIREKGDSLSKGISVERSTPDKKAEQVIMKLPYGDCIKHCAEFTEICDLKYRIYHRFKNFGPIADYFQEAMIHANPNKEISFKEYLNVLESQDYITAFHKIMASTPQKSEELQSIKKNNYIFLNRSETLKEIYKTMSIPYAFQSVRYKYHLCEDLLNLDVVLFPTMKSLSISDFLNYRTYRFFPLGISTDKIFADEFNLTSADVTIHRIFVIFEKNSCIMMKIPASFSAYGHGYKRKSA